MSHNISTVSYMILDAKIMINYNSKIHNSILLVITHIQSMLKGLNLLTF